MRLALTVIAAAAAAVTGFGYWHTRSHGTLYVHLQDKARANPQGHVYNGQLVFYDADGKVLARAKSDDRWGVVWPEHPAAGYCGPEIGGEAYQQCFRAHTTWLMEWVPHTRRAELRAGACHIRDIPVTVAAHPDNIFMWWLPLPHVGGLPRTNYSISITIDSRECRALQR